MCNSHIVTMNYLYCFIKNVFNWSCLFLKPWVQGGKEYSDHSVTIPVICCYSLGLYIASIFTHHCICTIIADVNTMKNVDKVLMLLWKWFWAHRSSEKISGTHPLGSPWVTLWEPQVYRNVPFIKLSQVFMLLKPCVYISLNLVAV